MLNPQRGEGMKLFPRWISWFFVLYKPVEALVNENVKKKAHLTNSRWKRKENKGAKWDCKTDIWPAGDNTLLAHSKPNLGAVSREMGTRMPRVLSQGGSLPRGYRSPCLQAIPSRKGQGMVLLGYQDGPSSIFLDNRIQVKLDPIPNWTELTLAQNSMPRARSEPTCTTREWEILLA